MVRKIFIVVNARTYSPKPIMAFSDAYEARDFAAKIHSGDYLDYIHEVQLVEGSVIDELLRELELKLDRKGIKITDVEFECDEDDNA